MEVDNPADMLSFSSWLSRNRVHVIRISGYEGCGCCVEIFYLELDGASEPMPCEGGGDFDGIFLNAGSAKDDIISDVIPHYSGALEPGAAPNGGPAEPPGNSEAGGGAPSVS
jgi:hypothetical protein